MRVIPGGAQAHLSGVFPVGCGPSLVVQDRTPPLSTPKKLRPRWGSPEPSTGDPGQHRPGGAERGAGRALPWSRRHKRVITATGVDLVELATDARVADRLRALTWVDGLYTRGGQPRTERISYCGTLHVARFDGEWGVEHASCRDRACPSCMRTRQRVISAALRLFVRNKLDAGADVRFVTLTQQKLPIEHERIAGAVDRILGSWSEMMNTKTRWGRNLRLLVCGGLRAVECVVAARGTKRKDGSTVAYTGAHAHLHVLWELTRPTVEAVERIVVELDRELSELAGRRATAVRAGLQNIVATIDAKRRRVVGLLARAQRIHAALLRDRDCNQKAEWSELADAVVRWRWRECSPEIADGAQCFMAATERKCAEITKYITKPFELRDAGLARELFVALDSRHCIRAFGSWRRWMADAEKLADQELADGRLGRELSRTPFSHVCEAVLVLERWRRDFPDLAAAGVRPQCAGKVLVVFRDREVVVDAEEILAGVRACGGTFRARDRRVRLALASEEGDQERGEKWLRDYMRSAAELTGLGLLDPADVRPPSPPERPPPENVEASLEMWRSAFASHPCPT